MPNVQLEWVMAGSGVEKDFRSMVVGWQRVVETLNAAVFRFNSKFFDKTEDPHHPMKLIAAKGVVVASLRESKLILEKWQNRLHLRSALSEATKDLKKSLNPTLVKIDALKEVRNLVFHFSDSIQEPDELLGLYEEIDGYNIEELNTMLRALVDLGFRMRQDALEAEERARRSTRIPTASVPPIAVQLMSLPE